MDSASCLSVFTLKEGKSKHGLIERLSEGVIVSLTPFLPTGGGGGSGGGGPGGRWRL